MSQTRYFVKRTVITFGLIFAVITGLFILFRSLPGGFLSQAAAQGVPPDQLAAIERRYGLDQPLHIQYFRYISGIITGDLGNSFIYNVDVRELVVPRLFNSFILIAPAITFAYISGAVYGTFLGNNQDKYIDRYGIIPVTIVGAIPEFFLAILLVVVFSGWLGIFPSSGFMTLQTRAEVGSSIFAAVQTADFWWHYTLPFSAVFLRYLYIPSLLMRTSVVEVKGQDFIHFHRVKGLSNFTRMKHTMKHASLPVITLFPASLTRALGGMVLIEVVFNWPGIGNLLVEAVLQRDFPVVQFVFFLIAVFVILGNYLVDLLYGVIDPRITIETSSD